ncbi:NRDE family protein [Polaribacter glomeratus]|uniref:NRDE family protein n=1 Tax=Polaribacter glomeratus TaxID=102 RepID=A0A2S7WYU9_9FLAO|nr:NRDE family protein [Polaribacter glomeratus]PQJ82743.1 hypothetical protein BTO16_09210 [Polaribacter glomeratus]TXD65288.1 NRDE family protein [Polaribacter glomeratus]
MCTVTYLPLKNNNFIITSNRDETPLRKTIPPKTYLENGIELTYPKDELAGGTWIGTSNKNRLVCLLNGAFTNHLRNKYYKVSRGVIVKNILSANDVVGYINKFDFIDIEPFTLILVDYQAQLVTYELLWDGTTKHFTKLLQEPKIWSSSTLYSEDMKQLRKDWFADWLSVNEDFKQEKIIQFHQNENLGSVETSPKMKRSFIKTVSTTSIKKENDKVAITYFDFLSDVVENNVIKILN